MFSRSKKHEAYERVGFDIGEILFKAPWFSALPKVVLDTSKTRFAVEYPGAEPQFFDASQIGAVEIVESQSESISGDKALVKAILENPSRISKLNAQEQGMCLGMGVCIEIVGTTTVQLFLPIIISETKRDSLMFKRLSSYAEELKDKFVSLRDASNAYG